MSHLLRGITLQSEEYLPQGLRRLSLAGFVAAYGFVLFYSIVPLQFDAGVGSDKVMHFLAYFGLMGLLGGALRHQRHLVLAMIILAITGGGLEGVQFALANRYASFADMGANLGGIATAALILFSRIHVHVYAAIAARFR